MAHIAGFFSVKEEIIDNHYKEMTCLKDVPDVLQFKVFSEKL